MPRRTFHSPPDLIGPMKILLPIDIKMLDRGERKQNWVGSDPVGMGDHGAEIRNEGSTIDLINRGQRLGTRPLLNRTVIIQGAPVVPKKSSDDSGRHETVIAFVQPSLETDDHLIVSTSDHEGRCNVRPENAVVWKNAQGIIDQVVRGCLRRAVFFRATVDDQLFTDAWSQFVARLDYGLVIRGHDNAVDEPRAVQLGELDAKKAIRPFLRTDGDFCF